MKTLIQTLTHTQAGLGATLLRIPVGAVFFAHGAQKLFGWFGGYGLEGTGQWMASVGFEPGFLMALLAGSAEFFGGLALMLGLLVRPAALVTAFTMLMAMTVHWPNGFFISNNGYEFAMTLLFGSLALSAQGAGRFSTDEIIYSRLTKQADSPRTNSAHSNSLHTATS